jgi:multimeric flavodoxin WrbA
MAVEFAGMGFRNKVGGAITVAYDRQGGLEGTIADLQRWYLTHDMIVVSVGPERPKTGIGCYYGVAALQGWPYPLSFSTDAKGSLKAVSQDVIGIDACKYLGKRVAEMTKVVKAGFQQVKTVWPYKGL